MDDPVVAASAGAETESVSTDIQAFKQNSTDEIAKFFEHIKNKQGIFDKQEHSSLSTESGIPATLSSTEPAELVVQKYDVDYKPKLSVNKKYVYSINELISISRQLPAGYAEGIVAYLPKKKFWRLNHRQPEHAGQSKSMGRRGSNKGLNGSGSGKGLSGDENNVFEKKGHKGKYARTSNGKKSNKFGKHDRGAYLEEKDVAVNNDDLQALEEEFEPTGNSMADFESWKAKMKEMERKKKGLPPIDQSTSSKPSLTKTSSSISDFLGLNRVNSDGVANNMEFQDIYKKAADDNNTIYKEAQIESAKGSYSRFSSFFAQSSSSSSLPTEKNTNVESEPLNVQNTESAPNSQNPQVPGGSRLLSFFKNESNTPKDSKNQSSLNNQEVGPNPMDSNIVPSHLPHVSHTSHSSHDSRGSEGSNGPHGIPQQEHRAMPPPTLPSQQTIAPDQLQTNNAFFQGLLNKGDLQNNDRNVQGPPPGVMLPPGGQTRFNLGQQPSPPPPHTRQPPGINVSRQFPVGMPPGAGGFPAPGPHPTFQSNGVQAVRHSDAPTLMNKNVNNVSQRNTQSGTNSNGGTTEGRGLQHSQAPPPSFQPGMVPPHFMPGMAPPGFPMMPPNFNPMYIPPHGGMMPPPAGQGFFPPMPPPSGNMNFNAFPMRPPMPQKQEAKATEIKK